MVEFNLKVKPKRCKRAKRKGYLGEFYRPNKIKIYLFALLKKEKKKYPLFIRIFNLLVNHEMMHYFIQKMRINNKIEERICVKME